MMRLADVPDEDVSYLDELLLEGVRLRLLPASELREIPPGHLVIWANKNARYGIPSAELVELVRELIGGRDAIEIGAGYGDLGHHLGIRMTDSAIQTTPEMRVYYATIGARIIDPPADIERIDGNAAVEKYKPKVVVGSWVTQLYADGDTPKRIGSSVYGVNEGRIVDAVECYIHVGNRGSHGQKRILARPHREIVAPFLFSRSMDPSANIVHVWGS